MTLALRVEGRTVRGEFALDCPPGTTAAKRDHAVGAILVDPLMGAATELSVVLAASPSSYAYALPGKDDEGRTRFLVRGRAEGDRLVPERPEAPTPKPRPTRRRR